MFACSRTGLGALDLPDLAVRATNGVYVVELISWPIRARRVALVVWVLSPSWKALVRDRLGLATVASTGGAIPLETLNEQEPTENNDKKDS